MGSKEDPTAYYFFSRCLHMNIVSYSGMTFILIWRFERVSPAKFWTKRHQFIITDINNKEHLLPHITRNPGIGWFQVG